MKFRKHTPFHPACLPTLQFRSARSIVALRFPLDSHYVIAQIIILLSGLQKSFPSQNQDMLSIQKKRPPWRAFFCLNQSTSQLTKI
jgi:hypothetical protein